MAFNAKGKTRHSQHCIEHLCPSCPCNTCKKDNYAAGTYVRCCWKLDKRCGAVCKSYVDERQEEIGND